MKLIERIEKHEMLRRWAIAEVYVEYLDAMNELVPQKTLQLLYSNDIKLEKEGISKSLKLHHLSLVDCFPVDVSWYLAELEITQSEFDKLRNLSVTEFSEVTNASFRVADAALALHKKPYLDLRINKIKQALTNGIKQVQWLGVTLLARSIEGPFTILEGNGRLISLYQILFIENNYHLLEGQIEVVIGISEEELKVAYKYID